MNKYSIEREKLVNNFKHVLRIMRITSFLLFFSILFSQAAAIYSQGVEFTLNLKSTSIKKICEKIEKQSDFRFIFAGNAKGSIDKKVNLTANALEIDEILNSVLSDTELEYRILDNQIVIYRDNANTRYPKEATFELIAQQKKTITGRITDQNGEPIIGANIIEKGTTNGTVTDVNGNFSFQIDPQAYIQVSYIGYVEQEVNAAGKNILNIILQENIRALNEVVVTALGIVKKEKSLTYATQIVDGEELTRAKDPNMINALAGKTAGVQINRSASGLGGSVKVVIRGDRSVTGSNQPLYVIDGVPINSASNNQTATTIGGNNDAGNRDGGDGISNLNPDDIESMNILKGPAAAALYGSSAANGVIVITTKKGKAGRINITFNTNTTWDAAAFGKPEFQNSYSGVTTSWGEKISGSPDYLKEFFQTGFTTINSVSLSSGSESIQTYFSYANTYGKGVVENNELQKHNFNFRETANFFNNRLTADANINVMYQNMKNRTSPGGFYMNPLVGLYRFPRGGVQGGESFNYYKDNYQYYNAERNMYLQNWYTEPTSWEQNPYWLTNMLPNDDQRYRTITNLSLSLKLNNYFKLQTRGNADFLTDNYEMKMYAGTNSALTGGSNGRYIVNESNSLNIYGDVLLTYQQQSNDFSINASVGASINDSRGKSIGMDSYPGGLYNPNLFSSGNIDHNGSSPSLGKYHGQEQAVFFAGQVGFRDWLYLDITARNDWTSTLAFTKYKNKGFFYPSAGLTWIINEALQLPEWINLGKIRGAWSKVGNGLPRYRSNPLNSVGRGGTISYNTTAPFNELKPEMTSSIETGTEWRLFGSRIEFDFTYYQTHTKKQLFSLAAPSGSKYTTYYVNAGNIKNEGIEITLSGSPIWTKDFRWKTGLNFALNRNKVIELAEGLSYFDFGGGGSNSYSMRLEVGGSFGDIYGRTFLRDEQGNIQYDSDGIPMPDKSDYKKIGNTAPDFNVGWQNTLTYKGLSLYFLIDGRVGGDVISLTQAELDKYGVSEVTGKARENGGVNFDGKVINNVERFYAIVGGRDGITEHYVYDATNVRLRELSLGYSLPKQLFENTSFIKGTDISLIGRNLFFFKNNAPYDPDGTLSVGNSLQGVHVFGMPSSRSFGFNIKVHF
jgi:TonB-linked SusC/RagA family outer membrane protein